MEKIKRFNIRIYMIIKNKRNEVLLSDEFALGMYITKFPGGGLEYGEGIADCIHREAMEEFGQDVEIIGHYYTTDFFQRAYYYTDSQLISIYYSVRFKEEPVFRISDAAFDFSMNDSLKQSFRRVAIDKCSLDEISLPIDRHVMKMLKKTADQY